MEYGAIEAACDGDKEAQRQLDELRLDAERYRFLRDAPWCVIGDPLHEVITKHKSALWDETIDAAIAMGELTRYWQVIGDYDA